MSDHLCDGKWHPNGPQCGDVWHSDPDKHTKPPKPNLVLRWVISDWESGRWEWQEVPNE